MACSGSRWQSQDGTLGLSSLDSALPMHVPCWLSVNVPSERFYGPRAILKMRLSIRQVSEISGSPTTCLVLGPGPRRVYQTRPHVLHAHAGGLKQHHREHGCGHSIQDTANRNLRNSQEDRSLQRYWETELFIY